MYYEKYYVHVQFFIIKMFYLYVLATKVYLLALHVLSEIQKQKHVIFHQDLD